MQPAAQQPAAHRRRAVGRCSASERRLVAPRRLVSSSRLRRVAASMTQRLVARSRVQRAHVRQSACAACRARTAAARRRRRSPASGPRQPKPREVVRAELRAELALRRVRSRSATPAARSTARAARRRRASASSASRSSAGAAARARPRSASRPSTSSDAEARRRRGRARRGRSAGRSRAAPASRFSRRVVEQRLVGQRAGRDDAHDLALDRALRVAGIADLLADRDRLAQLHQPREIALGRVDGHAGHRDRRAGRTAPRCVSVMSSERAAAARVVVEELVEIAHAVEEERRPDTRP